MSLIALTYGSFFLAALCLLCWHTLFTSHAPCLSLRRPCCVTRSCTLLFTLLLLGTSGSAMFSHFVAYSCSPMGLPLRLCCAAAPGSAPWETSNSSSSAAYRRVCTALHSHAPLASPLLSWVLLAMLSSLSGWSSGACLLVGSR